MSKTTVILLYWVLFCILVCVCFMPWSYYADVHSSFTGFYSHQNIYGKPAYFLFFMCILNGILLFSSALWARYVSLGISSLFFAYGIRTFYLYSVCNFGICPDVNIGLWLMALSVFGLFVLSLFGKVRKQSN